MQRSGSGMSGTSSDNWASPDTEDIKRELMEGKL
jgi:hypothetical protein